MAFQLPDSNQLKRLADELNLVLDEQKTRALLGYMQPFAAAYEFIDQCTDELPVSAGPQFITHQNCPSACIQAPTI